MDLCLREGIRNLILTHHDPRSTEEKGDRMCMQATEHLKTQLPAYQEIWDKMGQPEGPHVQSAYDGMEFNLDKIAPRLNKPKTGAA